MSMYDRDWYREEYKEKEKRAQQGHTSHSTPTPTAPPAPPRPKAAVAISELSLLKIAAVALAAGTCSYFQISAFLDRIDPPTAIRSAAPAGPTELPSAASSLTDHQESSAAMRNRYAPSNSDPESVRPAPRPRHPSAV